MTVIGLDDTDSATLGMCTTYVATLLAEQVEAADGTVDRLLLLRCNPAVEHKTRGNAALAIHCDLPVSRATELARGVLDRAETDDESTNPGIVVAPWDSGGVPEGVAEFAATAVTGHHDLAAVKARCADLDLRTITGGNGRGVIGALAAAGAWSAFDEWTYEYVAYREPERWGTERDVDPDSVFAAADWGYPDVWDTVDREERTAVCVPRTPCPVLYGIRGDDVEVVRDVARRIESEPVARRQLFVSNQGTDAHLQTAPLDAVTAGHSYRVRGTVAEPPETREGGHVFFELADDDVTLLCAAFEPTKHFREHVRRLRPGDELTVCGEVSDGTLKLEKVAIRRLVTTESVTPDCPECDNSMESAGRNAGYRCRDCGTSTDGRVDRLVDRDLETGWYEVPPCARRHIAKPLVRGGFDAPTHPER